MLSQPSVLCNCCHDSLLTSPLNSLYLMSRPLDLVATLWSLQRMSRQPGVVATSIPYFCYRDCLMMSLPQVFAIDVATTKCCRDLPFLQLLSRLLDDVATSFLWNCCRDNQVLSRPLFFTTAVATSDLS